MATPAFLSELPNQTGMPERSNAPQCIQRRGQGGADSQGHADSYQDQQSQRQRATCVANFARDAQQLGSEIEPWEMEK